MNNRGPVSDDKPRPKGISIVMSITALFVFVAIFASAGMLFVVENLSRSSVEELHAEKAELLSRAIQQRIAAQVRPAEAQAGFLADLLARHDLQSADETSVARLLQASLAAAAQVSSVALVSEDLSLIRAFRNRPEEPIRVSNWSDETAFAELVSETWTRNSPAWGRPFYAESSGETLISYFTPFRDAEGHLALIISSVSLFDLSAYLGRLEVELDGTPFILYGRDGVLAHPEIARRRFELSDQIPVPPLLGFPDERPSLALAHGPGPYSVSGEERYLLLDIVEELGPEPWYIGAVFDLVSFSPSAATSGAVVFAGLGLALAAALAALIIGRMISLPIRVLSSAAGRIGELDVERPLELQRSIFHEVNQANDAFAAAFRALRSLRLYLPRSLAPKLLKMDDPTLLRSQSRDVSVMFTDIIGFTAMSENMEPSQVASLLNDHFALVTHCVQEQGGFVDKFIGDAVMAFWGGLEDDTDHAAHACRAALCIRTAIARENMRRAATGASPVRVRIGIHSGETIVGNIGGPGRANFTIIGDTVNVAERIEQMARSLSAVDWDTAILISQETAERVGERFELRSAGEHPLKGRSRGITVFELSGQRALP